MHRNHCEPTLEEILSDSVTLAVMQADGVDASALAAMLRQLAPIPDANSCAASAGRWMRACVTSLFMLPVMACPVSSDDNPNDVSRDAVIDCSVADGQTADPPAEERT